MGLKRSTTASTRGWFGTVIHDSCLDPLPAPRHTAAIDELCHALNDTNTVCPGTDLTLRYSIKSHR